MKHLRSDIDTEEKVRALVDAFYSKVQQDPLIGPVFARVVKDWTPHLERMTSFWSSMLLGTGTYRAEPFPKHLPLGIDERHFDRWLELFQGQLDELYQGEKADEIKNRAITIGHIFSAKIKMLTEQGDS